MVVAVDSPAGQVAEAIDQLAAHLPPPGQPWVCPLCSTQFWPCAEFDDAARRVQAAGLRVGELVSLDLHPRLWPPQPPSQPPAPSTPPARATPPTDTWFNEEQHDG